MIFDSKFLRKNQDFSHLRASWFGIVKKIEKIRSESLCFYGEMPKNNSVKVELSKFP